jgi:hypothetical protein
LIGPGNNPNWFHRELRLEIGKVPYIFRTLSLFDVWAVWPHLAPIHEAIVRGRPLDFSDRLLKVLEIIQPVLAADDERIRELTPVHIDTLINFYDRQDWSRIKALVEKTTAAGAEAQGADPEEAHNRFIVICQATARYCNMAMTDFLQTRFEFAADQMLALHQQAKSQSGAAESWDEFGLKAMLNFGAPQRVRMEDSPLARALDEKLRTN